MDWSQRFAGRVKNGELKVGIIGLGYVGLPTAIGFHDAGFEVWGVDVSQRTVDMVLKGGKILLATLMSTILSQPPALNAGTSRTSCCRGSSAL